MSEKDIHRYSTSRITTFKQCPRKHHYIYVEQVEQPEGNIYTTSGKLWHKAMDNYGKGLDIQPVIDEWKKLCLSGKLDCDPDLLEYVLKEYFNYYKKDLSMESVIETEYEFKDELEDDDYLVGSIDKIYTSLGYNYIKDYKTTFNPLKYTTEDVQTNQQLLLYLTEAEAKLEIKIDAIEIDEIRLAKLQPVPVRANGKPSTDKKQLSLVTYEAYYDALESQGLENEKEYQPVLEYLQQRGHPLFNRIICQILDRSVISTNATDILEAYHSAKTDPTYKVHGPLCKFCDFKELCDLDAYNPDDMSREMIKEKIKNS